MGKELICSLVKNHFYLEEESNEKFEHRLFNPEIDDVYKSFGLDENLRRYWKLESSLLESVDRGWAEFKERFSEFVKEYNVTYDDFRENRIIIDKNERKIPKLVKEYYMDNPSKHSSVGGWFGYRGKEEEFLSDYWNIISNFSYIVGTDYAEKSFKEALLNKEEIYENAMSHKFRSIFNSIGEVKMPNRELYLVLSLNFEDWFFCSSGETWSSCLNVNSDYSFWIGLPGLVLDTNRAMIYITDKSQKNPIKRIDKEYHLDRFLFRSWTLLLDNKKIGIVGSYPLRIITPELVNSVIGTTLFVKLRDYKNHSSKNYFDLLYFKNCLSLSIFNDDCCINFTEDGRGKYQVRDDIRGVFSVDKKYSTVYNGPLSINFEDGGLSGLHKYSQTVRNYLDIPDEVVFCSYCNRMVDPAMVEYSREYSDYMCHDCFWEIHTRCSCCGRVTLLDKASYIDGNSVCFECERAKDNVCAECYAPGSSHHLRLVNKTEYLCTHCLLNSEVYEICTICSDIVVKEKSRHNGNFYYCDKCF